MRVVRGKRDGGCGGCGLSVEDEMEGAGEEGGCPWKTRGRVWGGVRVVRGRRGGGCGGCGLSMEDEVEGVGDAGCPWKTTWSVWG